MSLWLESIMLVLNLYLLSCVDHSFVDTDIVKCRVEFLNLAGSLAKNTEKKIKANQKKNKLPIYTGVGAVDMSQYLK